MHFIEFIVMTKTYVVGLFSSAKVEEVGHLQTPLFNHDGNPAGDPVIKPPTGRSINLPGGDLMCDYSAMGPEWKTCSSETNREMRAEKLQNWGPIQHHDRL